MTDGKKIASIFDNFRGLSSVGIGNVVSSVIGGIFWLFLAGLIGAENYGQVSYIIAIAGIASTISGVGAGNTLIVFTAKKENIQSAIILITIVSSSIASIILFILFYDFGASVYVIGVVIFSLVSSELLGRKYYAKYSAYLISQRLSMVGLAILFYYLIGTDGIILGIGLSFLPYSYKLFKIFRKSEIDFKLLRSKKKFIMNSYILDLRGVFIGSVDKIIIVPLLGFTLLGNYQLGIQIFTMLVILPSIVFQYTVPQDASGNLNSKLKLLTILISILFAVISIIFAPYILPTLFPEFTNAVEIVQIISLAVVPSTIVTMYLSKFLGNENNKNMLIGTSVYLIIQILGIIILGTLYGINGVAISMVLAVTSEACYFIIIDKWKNESN
jgi:O-antigen/teichoic acid export membrane protein